jgi:hypothetical protein
MMRKRTPITICSFLFPMEGTVPLGANLDAARVAMGG